MPTTIPKIGGISDTKAPAIIRVVPIIAPVSKFKNKKET